MKTSECECGATVIGTGYGTTTDGEEIARCAVCKRMVIVTETS